MESYSQDSKRSSRRGFTGSIIAAFAGLQLLDSIANAQRSGQKKKSDRPRIETHDTPPPFTFEDGSLNIESKHEMVWTNTNPPQPPYVYTSPFGGTANFAHIRILDREGNDLYYEDPRGATIKVLLHDEDNNNLGEITVTGGTVLRITSSVLRLNSHTNMKPHSFRKHRIEHPGPPNKAFRIKRLEIIHPTKGFGINAGTHNGYFSEEYRIWAWFDR